MKYPIIAIAFLIISTSSASGMPARTSTERHIHMKGFDGTVRLTELPGNEVEVRIQTGSTTRDTVSGGRLSWVYAHGIRERFYFGHFGESPIPMLVFAVSDGNDRHSSRVIAYQVTERGALIGQQVSVDESITHGHTEHVTSGQYALAGIDGNLGAIYTVASQIARFEGYFVSYEKLRVRQWDPAISSFIETDCGFLRDRDGRLMQATRFDSWNDDERWDAFAANVETNAPKMMQDSTEPKAIPARAEK